MPRRLDWRSVWRSLPLLAAALIALACLTLALKPFEKPQPERIALRPAATPGPRPAMPHGDIAVNSADLAQLQELPGIGPKLAERIIEARALSPFFYPEDLKAVPGIGDKRLAQIWPFIRMD